MALDNIIEGVITLFIVVVLTVVMAPVLIEIGKATEQVLFGYLGAGILVVFAIIVFIGMIATIFKR